MHRSYPNVVPVANKYLGHKQFLKDQADLEHNVRFYLIFIMKIKIFLD